jgi:hypothetical protein
MRRLLVSLGLAAMLTAGSVASALAAPSSTQVLPDAACNAGTMNAHESVPETTGSGKTTPGHIAIPGEHADGTCGHGEEE